MSVPTVLSIASTIQVISAHTDDGSMLEMTVGSIRTIACHQQVPTKVSVLTELLRLRLRLRLMLRLRLRLRKSPRKKNLRLKKRKRKRKRKTSKKRKRLPK